MNTCDNCRFWETYEGMDKQGYCCRYPPVPIADVATRTEGECGEYQHYVESTTESAWPITHADEWCGEWMPTLAHLAYPNAQNTCDKCQNPALYILYDRSKPGTRGSLLCQEHIPKE